MNRKSFFRIAWGITLLLAFSLGCKLVDQAQEVIALATDLDVEGLATDMDLESLVTDIGGLATDFDVEGMATDMDMEGLATEMATQMSEMATEMAPLMTQMGAIMTDMPGFEGTLIAVSTPSGFPGDVPVMPGQALNMSGSATQLEYSLDTDFNTAVDFYRREMAARGWTEGSSRVEEGEAHLVFQMGNRQATVSISEDFLFGLSIEISLQG